MSRRPLTLLLVFAALGPACFTEFPAEVGEAGLPLRSDGGLDAGPADARPPTPDGEVARDATPADARPPLDARPPADAETPLDARPRPDVGTRPDLGPDPDATPPDDATPPRDAGPDPDLGPLDAAPRPDAFGPEVCDGRDNDGDRLEDERDEAEAACRLVNENRPVCLNGRCVGCEPLTNRGCESDLLPLCLDENERGSRCVQCLPEHNGCVAARPSCAPDRLVCQVCPSNGVVDGLGSYTLCGAAGGVCTYHLAVPEAPVAARTCDALCREAGLHCDEALRIDANGGPQGGCNTGEVTTVGCREAVPASALRCVCDQGG